jgi:hypothetical protein
MRSLCCIVALLTITSPTIAQEAVAKSKIVSLGVFKNGLVVVKREVEIAKDGTYRLDALPEPVHGSFWIESNARVDVSVKMREVETPLHTEGQVRLQHDLAGKKVTLYFRNDKIPAVTGTILKLAKPQMPEGLIAGPGEVRHEDFWILQTAKGRAYVNPSDVMMVQTEDAAEKSTQKKPVLILNVAKADKKPAVYVSYLTNGMAWAPSYHVDITDPKSLAIEMAAVVRNELVDLDDVEVKLISGFPSVEFARVTSPLSARTTLTKFFQEITGRHDGLYRQDMTLHNAIVFNQSEPVVAQPMGFARPNLGAIPAGEGVDLHFESIGKRSMLRDEAFSLTVGKAKADYERVVEWTVGTSPVARKYGVRAEQKDEMWDVLLYKNPFKFPMTTAPAMVVENGKFNGQRTSYWSNVGEEANLRITRSLSIRALAREEADSKPSERVVFDDKTYSKIYLKGELTMSNHRNQPVKMHVRHAIRGIISEIDGDPKRLAREESLEDINRIHEVIWTVSLNPGEERKLAYKYSVLVYR